MFAAQVEGGAYGGGREHGERIAVLPVHGAARFTVPELLLQMLQQRLPAEQTGVVHARGDLQGLLVVFLSNKYRHSAILIYSVLYTLLNAGFYER